MSLAQSVERRRSLLRAAAPDVAQLAFPFGNLRVTKNRACSSRHRGSTMRPTKQRTPNTCMRSLSKLPAAKAKSPRSFRILRRGARTRARVHRVSRHAGASRKTAAGACARLHGGMTPGQRQRVARELRTGPPHPSCDRRASEGRICRNVVVSWSTWSFPGAASTGARVGA